MAYISCPGQPLGTAYLNGKVFVADFRAGTLVAVGTSTGVYTPVVPTSAQGVISYKSSGEVKVGPDGLLYVLNNGEGEQALYVMQPDGTLYIIDVDELIAYKIEH